MTTLVPSIQNTNRNANSNGHARNQQVGKVDNAGQRGHKRRNTNPASAQPQAKRQKKGQTGDDAEDDIQVDDHDHHENDDDEEDDIQVDDHDHHENDDDYESVSDHNDCDSVLASTEDEGTETEDEEAETDDEQMITTNHLRRSARLAGKKKDRLRRF